MLTKWEDPAHKQKAIYSLTKPSIELVLFMTALSTWGREWLPVSEELSIRARVLEEGGPELWDCFMAELRQEHLGIPWPARRPAAGQFASVSRMPTWLSSRETVPSNRRHLHLATNLGDTP